jgi:hypothetical protein
MSENNYEEEFEFISGDEDIVAEAQPSLQVSTPEDQAPAPLPQAEAGDGVRIRLTRPGAIKTVGKGTAQQLISRRLATLVKE